jgi:hypothetical protein
LPSLGAPGAAQGIQQDHASCAEYIIVVASQEAVGFELHMLLSLAIGLLNH